MSDTKTITFLNQLFNYLTSNGREILIVSLKGCSLGGLQLICSHQDQQKKLVEKFIIRRRCKSLKEILDVGDSIFNGFVIESSRLLPDLILGQV